MSVPILYRVGGSQKSIIERYTVKIMDRIAKVDVMEQNIIDQMGAEAALQAIVRALSYDTKENVYSYICREYEIKIENDED